MPICMREIHFNNLIIINLMFGLNDSKQSLYVHT